LGANFGANLGANLGEFVRNNVTVRVKKWALINKNNIEF
jgi:hypothetical protein